MKVTNINANINKQIMIGQMPSPEKQGITQHTITKDIIDHVELSHNELYLVPLYFSIFNSLLT